MSTPDVPPQEHGCGAGFRVGGRLLARNTAINLAGRIVPLLVGVAAMPYVVHRLGPDRFGILALAWIVVGYFALFDLGIGPATTKFVAEYLGRGEAEKLPELIWTAVITQSCFGVVAGILLAVVSPVLVDRLLKIPLALHGQAHLVFLILALSLPATFAAGSLGGVLAASQRFDLFNAVSVPASALNYLLPVVALALGYGLPAIVAFLVLARVVMLAVSFLLCVRLYPTLGLGLRFDHRVVWPLLGFGGWVSVSGVVVPVLVYFDRFLIGAVVSVAAVGIYTPPFMVASRLGVLPASLSTALFPAASTSAGRGDSEWVRDAMVRSLKYMLLLVGPAALLLIFFARPLLTLWVGAAFAREGTLVLQILAVGVLANALTYVPYSLIQGIGRPDLTAKLQVAQLPVHLAISWFLVTRLGLRGAALAWTIRMLAEFSIFIIAGCWATRTPARLLATKELRRSLETLAALALGLAILWASTHALIPDAAFTLLLGGGFLLAAWNFVLDTEERWQIRLWLGATR